MKKCKPIFLFLLAFWCVSPELTAQTQSASSLAFAYYNDGEWAKAAPLFLEIYSSNQAKPYLKYYTRCLIELEEFDEALKELRKAYRKTDDITLYIDQAYIHELKKENKQAAQLLEKPFSEFPQTANGIRNLGNAYISYQKFDQAQRSYEIGRAILKQPDEFRMEMATLYRLQRRHAEMLDEFLALLLNEPNYIQSVENYLLSALTGDIDNNLLEMTKNKTLAYLQQFPGLTVFSELLIWVYIQEQEFDLAVDQAIALDVRSRNTGTRTLQLARTARQEGFFADAIRAYTFLTKQTFSETVNKKMPVSPALSPALLAHIERNQTKLEQLENNKNKDPHQFTNLLDDYAQVLSMTEDQQQKSQLFKDMAYISVYHLNNPANGRSLIDSALHYATRSRQLHTDCLLDKADYLMVGNDPWQATLLYARIDKENQDTPAGSLAKLKKAKAAFYMQDFSWALSQLDVLKGSSSKLIANDAFELAMLIKENQSPEDSLNMGLQALAKVKFLEFQKETGKSMRLIDSIISQEKTNLVHDDALFLKAELLRQAKRQEEAKELYRQVIDNYYQGIWGHKSLFRLGELLFSEEQYEEAKSLLNELVQQFPNSFYNLDARNILREINRLLDHDTQSQ